jgi:hypothetical protein
MAGGRFDRDRFAYELAQELGVDYAPVPDSRPPGAAVRAVQDDIQATMEVGPRTGVGRAGVTAGAASGLSAVNRARRTPTRPAAGADADDGDRR